MASWKATGTSVLVLAPGLSRRLSADCASATRHGVLIWSGVQSYCTPPLAVLTIESYAQARLLHWVWHIRSPSIDSRQAFRGSLTRALFSWHACGPSGASNATASEQSVSSHYAQRSKRTSGQLVQNLRKGTVLPSASAVGGRQSSQSVPRAQMSVVAPAPPSSHTWLLAHDPPHEVWTQVFKQRPGGKAGGCGGGCGGGGDGGGGDGEGLWLYTSVESSCEKDRAPFSVMFR